MAYQRTCPLGLLLAVALSVASRAELLPVINPSFEDLSRPLAVGEQTNGAAGAGVPVATRFPFGGGGVSWDHPVEVPGWRTFYLPPPNTAISYVGALNPPPRSNGDPFITGYDGSNVCAVQAARIGQTLDVRLQPNTRYRLDFLGGIGLFDSPYFLHCGLIALDNLNQLPLENQPGVQRLVLASFDVAEDSHGTMRAYSLEYITPAVLPSNLVDRYLGIHLYGSDGIPRVLYDNFQLDATPVPEPAAGILLLIFSMLRMARSRGD